HKCTKIFIRIRLGSNEILNLEGKMKRFVSFFMITLIVVGAIYVLIQQDFFKNMEKPEELVKPLELSIKDPNQEKKDILPLLKGTIFDWMGKNSQQVLDKFGKPTYKHLTPYGYTWWVYTDGKTSY